MSLLSWIWLRSLAGKSFYMVAVVAVAVAAWLLASALAAPFMNPGLTPGSGAVIISATGVTTGKMMPLTYVSQVLDVPGVHGLMYESASQVLCGAEAFPVSIDALGGPNATSLLMHGDAALGKRWDADRLGVLVSPAAAQRCGWQPGMTISPRDPILHQPIEMHVVGTAPGLGVSAHTPLIYAHYAYFNQIHSPMIQRDTVSIMVAIPKRASAAQKLAVHIEEAFATRYPAIEAHTNAVVQNGLTRFGKVQYVLLLIMLAILLCTALVMVSVLAHLFAQHVAQQAMLQVLGFSRGALFTGFAMASLTLLLTGVALGVTGGQIALHMMPDLLAPAVPVLALPSWAWWGLPIWLSALLLVSLSWPALRMAHLRPTHVRAI